MSSVSQLMPPSRESLTVVRDVVALRAVVENARRDGLRIGLVPTMGALHAGHLSLMEAARAECDFVIVSIFVNPAQFGPNEDYRRYPRPIEDDLDACATSGVSLVFQPDAEDVYPEGFTTHVDVEGLSTHLEGAFRPGHFRGVTTVVLKLCLMSLPDVAYFGRKDYQQQLIIRTMCRDLNVPVTIRTCPIVRDPDGLAISSRNAYLSVSERESALSLSRSLHLAEERLQSGETDLQAIQKEMLDCLRSQANVKVDYAVIADPHTLMELEEPRNVMIALIAAHVGNTRLIDNREIHLGSGES